jgi:hypothetical protein
MVRARIFGGIFRTDGGVVIVDGKPRLYIPCPNCPNGSWRGDHLSIGFKTHWACESCHWYSNIERISEGQFKVEGRSEKETPVTVTLKSVTEPPIYLKLNAWKYAHSQKDTPEEYAGHQEYFYNEHTCPTNWTREIEQIIFQGDTDPHGVFQFVSVVDGHLET